MPSKNYNGNNPLGRARIKSNGLDTNGALARVETEIGRLQPALSLQTGSLQLPNGRVQVPRRARRGGGGTAAGCIPWKPSLTNTGTAELPAYEITLNAGTINGVINSNWNTGVSVSTAAIQNSTPLYILAVVSLTNNVTTSISYEITSTLPAGDVLDPATKGALPTTMKVILGVWTGQTSCMVHSDPFSLVSYEAFKEDNPSPAIGELSYFSWYKLKITKPA